MPGRNAADETGPCFVATDRETIDIARDAISAAGGAALPRSDDPGAPALVAFASTAGALGFTAKLNCRAAVHPDPWLAANLWSRLHPGQVACEARLLHASDLGTRANIGRDLGIHRLEPLGPGRSIAQLAPVDELLPLRSPATVHNLPIETSPFLGRWDEINTIANAVTTSPVVTLVGPGGVGKTRLAMRAAVATPSAWSRVVWCDLGSVGAGTAVEQAVVDAIGVEIADLPVVLANERLLVVFDTCEHVIDAVSQTVTQIVSTCTTVAVLATSREPLGIDHEMIVDVEPLATPEAPPSRADEHPAWASAAVRSPAVRLFAAVATRVRPTFEATPSDLVAIAELVRNVGGLPLAIEIVASRCRTFSPDQISRSLGARLESLSNDMNPAARQATLAASVEWSVAPLGDEARQAMEVLATFRGGATLDDIIGVRSMLPGQQAAETATIADVVDRLVEQSLAVRDDGERPRYRLLDPIRQHVLSVATDRGGLADAHATWFSDRAEHQAASLDERWTDHGFAEAVANLENFDQALDTHHRAGRFNLEADMVWHLRTLWKYAQTSRVEAHATRVLESEQALTPTEAARVWLARAELRSWAQDFGFATDAEQAIERASDDAIIEGRARCLRAIAFKYIDPTRSESEFDAALAVSESAGDHAAARYNRFTRGIWPMFFRDLRTPARTLDEFEQVVAEQASPVFDAWGGGVLAIGLSLGGDGPAARRALARSEAALERLAGLCGTRRASVLRGSPAWAVVLYADFLGRHLAEPLRPSPTPVAGDTGLLPELASFCLDAARGAAAGRAHDAAAAARFWRSALDRAVARDLGFLQSHVLLALADAEIGCGNLDHAEQLLASEPIARQAASDGGPAPVLARRAQIAVLRGDFVSADRAVSDVLRPDNSLSLWEAVVALDIVAEIHAQRGNITAALRLTAATTAIRNEHGLLRAPVGLDDRADRLQAAWQADGHAASELAAAEGRSLRIGEALEFARRSRGARSAGGSTELTPTERAVCLAAARGLTNKQVASELLMSPETVKSHLARSYSKLGVRNRAQLAVRFHAEMTEP